MATRLLLLRHARIEAQYVGRLIGATDLPADAEGLLQARMMTGRLARWAPQACYCSPLERCRQTASAVAPDLPPQMDADLREIDFGDWEARTFAEAAADNPSIVDRWAAFSPDFAFPGGESVEGFLCRVRRVAQRLVDAAAQTVLAVTHGGIIRAMLCHLLGLEPRHYVAFDVHYAGLAVVDLFGGKGVLAALERPDAAEGGHG
jgi:broad specificity phosphatase PhoE